MVKQKKRNKNNKHKRISASQTPKYSSQPSFSSNKSEKIFNFLINPNFSSFLSVLSVYSGAAIFFFNYVSSMTPQPSSLSNFISAFIICILILVIICYHHSSYIKKHKRRIALEKKHKSNYIAQKQYTDAERCEYTLHDLYCQGIRHFIIVLFFGMIISISFGVTAAPITNAALSVFFQPNTPGSSSTAQTDSGQQITTTPHPAPTVAPHPTFSPVPIDSAQIYYDSAWDRYFSHFNFAEITSIEDAASHAYTILTSIWLNPQMDFLKTWAMEEIEIYYQSPYEKTAQFENQLRQTGSLSDQYITGISYVESTNSHINSKQNLEERNLGVACLRGIELLTHYIGNEPSSFPETGNAYNKVAILLRQCADEVYHGTGYRSFVLYTFSYVCYKEAADHNYNIPEINKACDAMIDAMENTFSYISNQ